MNSAKIVNSSVLICFIFIPFFSLISAGNKKIVEIKKVLSILDNGIDFYFKYPAAPVLDKYGSIYIADDKQLLKFDKSGNFKGNYYRQGLGPGELTNLMNVFIRQNYWVAFNWSPCKVLWFSQKDTKLLKETKISPRIGWANFLTFYKNKFFFFNESFPRTKNNAVFVNL